MLGSNTGDKKMHELIKRIKKDLKEAMKKEIQLKKTNEYSELRQGVQMKLALSIKESTRAIISMFPEIGIKPENATDEQTIPLIKKYIFMEKTRLLFLENHIGKSDVIWLSPKQLTNLYKIKIKALGEKLDSLKIMSVMVYLPE